MGVNTTEVAALRDRVARANLASERPAVRELSPKEEAGRQALAAIHEAERRHRAKGGLPAPKLVLKCVYCGETVRLGDQSKKRPVPPATCRLHRDLPALDSHYGGGYPA